MKRKFSRLDRKQESHNLKLAFFYGLLTFVLALGVVLFGIPLLIRLAVFLGDVRSSSLPVESRDTVPPPPPIFTTSLEATSSSQIILVGYAEPSSSVFIDLNGTLEKEIVADNEGLFKTEINLTEGNNQIEAIAKDQAGNESSQSDSLKIVLDDEPPELELTFPEEERITIHEEKVNLTGKTETEATLIINERLVIIDREGNFEYPINLKEGDNEIMFVVEDKAGNKIEKIITINYSS